MRWGEREREHLLSKANRGARQGSITWMGDRQFLVGICHRVRPKVSLEPNSVQILQVKSFQWEYHFHIIVPCSCMHIQCCCCLTVRYNGLENRLLCIILSFTSLRVMDIRSSYLAIPINTSPTALQNKSTGLERNGVR